MHLQARQMAVCTSPSTPATAQRSWTCRRGPAAAGSCMPTPARYLETALGCIMAVKAAPSHGSGVVPVAVHATVMPQQTSLPVHAAAGAV